SHISLRNEDCQLFVNAAPRARIGTVREQQLRIEVPGPARPDAQPLLAELRAMKVLVAGGTGFVGTAIVHAFRARELDVVVLARRPDRAAPLESIGVEIVPGDLTD